eukprot:4501708-Amphidinium_carterae.1
MLTKEFPVSFILQQSPDFLAAFVSAMQAEYASWEKWGPAVPVPEKEAQAILADPSKRKRVMSARTIYRNKEQGLSQQLKAKART